MILGRQGAFSGRLHGVSVADNMLQIVAAGGGYFVLSTLRFLEVRDPLQALARMQRSHGFIYRPEKGGRRWFACFAQSSWEIFHFGWNSCHVFGGGLPIAANAGSTFIRRLGSELGQRGPEGGGGRSAMSDAFCSSFGALVCAVRTNSWAGPLGFVEPEHAIVLGQSERGRQERICAGPSMGGPAERKDGAAWERTKPPPFHFFEDLPGGDLRQGADRGRG